MTRFTRRIRAAWNAWRCAGSSRAGEAVWTKWPFMATLEPDGTLNLIHLQRHDLSPSDDDMATLRPGLDARAREVILS